MSTVAVIGGAGEMGATAVTTLATDPAVDRVIVADRRLEAARQLAQTAGPEAEAVAVDIEAGDELRGVVAGADVVLNTAGPFFRHGVAVLDACITEGVDYLDICDDPEPTIELLGRDAAARGAGITAVIGMGASPGLTNLMARMATEHLHQVTDAFSAWPLDVGGPGQEDDNDLELHPDGRPPAAAVHFLEQLTGDVPVVEDGRLVRRRPFQPIGLTYPGRRSGTAYTVGHPEPLSFVNTLGVDGRSYNLFMARPATLAFLHRLVGQVEATKTTIEAAARSLAEPGVVPGLRALVAQRRFDGPGDLPAFFVLLSGSYDGRERTVGAELLAAPAGMDGITAIPAALAVAQILDGETEPGVHPPEAVIDAPRLFADLVPHCTEEVDEIVAITSEDGPAST